MTSTSVQLKYLAYIVGAVPILTVYTTYLIAWQQGHVPSCIPNLDGCTSISATGRHAPEALVFRALMIPAAVLMALFWYACRAWLIRAAACQTRQYDILLVLGLLSSLFLVIYSTALGHIGEAYALQRRIGVTLFFSCGLLAQLITLNQACKLVSSGQLSIPQIWLRLTLAVCVLMLLTGLSMLPLTVILSGDSRVDNIIEWNYAILMYLYFPLVGVMWSITGFSMHFKSS